MEQRTIESFFFLGLLTGVFVLVVFMLGPFLKILFLAGVLALLLSGINERLVVRFKHRGMAAFVTTAGTLIVILVPLGFLLWIGAQEAAGLYRYLQTRAASDGIVQMLSNLWDQIRPLVPWVTPEKAPVASALQALLGWIVSHTGSAFAGLGSVVINTFVLLFILFFFLRDSAIILRKAMELSPLSDRHEHALIDTITSTLSATVRGKLLISFLQSIAAGIGFWLFNVPAPVLWGAAVMIASFIPNIGTALIMVPMIAYLLITNTIMSAMGLALWALLVVSLLDNFLGPKLMARGTHVHPLLMFLAVLGGLSLFGPIGILLGPVVMALLSALFTIYLSLVKHGPLPTPQAQS